MNITTSKQAEKLAEIGSQFKRIREEQNLSIPHLTATTLISERYLRAIENGEIESLPEPVYVRGFIRKYGTALGIGDLSEEFPLEPVLPDNKWVGSPAAELRPLHLYALYVAVIAGAVGLLATFLNPPDANQINDSATNLSDVAKVESRKTANRLNPINLLSPQTSGLSIFRQVMGIPVPTSSSLTNPTQDTTKVTLPNVTPTNASSQSESSLGTFLNSLATSADSLERTNALTDIDGNFQFPANKPVNLGVVMRNQSWLRVTVDGKTEFEGVLSEGKKLSWSADRQISIRVGNASAVALSYNNRPLTILGKDGEVVERLFTPNMVKVEADSRR
ncbi:MAG: DUF4115 domain-containing protein [Pseudanabaenaceae cyanobacterium bins.39]|nr:DUF4115 domain-containing protein [Pseudanabaenaceae cyanobacterium bins.39]